MQAVANDETKSFKTDFSRGSSGFSFISPFVGKGMVAKSLGRVNTFRGMVENYAARLATVQSKSSMNSEDIEDDDSPRRHRPLIGEVDG